MVDSYLDEFEVKLGGRGSVVTGLSERRGVGPARDETVVAVAEAFFAEPGSFGVARRDGYPDALAGGAHVAAYGGPLVLTYTNGPPDETLWVAC